MCTIVTRQSSRYGERFTAIITPIRIFGFFAARCTITITITTISAATVTSSVVVNLQMIF